MSQRPGRSKTSLESPTFLSLRLSSTSLPEGSGGHHETQDRSLSSCWAWGLRTQLRASLPVKSPWKAPGQCLPWPGLLLGSRGLPPQLATPLPGRPPPSFGEPRAAAPLLHLLCRNPAVRWLPRPGPCSAVLEPNRNSPGLSSLLPPLDTTIRHWRVSSLGTADANTPVSEMQVRPHTSFSEERRGGSCVWPRARPRGLWAEVSRVREEALLGEVEHCASWWWPGPRQALRRRESEVLGMYRCKPRGPQGSSD